MKETVITLNGKKYTVDYDFKEDYREEDELMEELSFKEKLEE